MSAFTAGDRVVMRFPTPLGLRDFIGTVAAPPSPAGLVFPVLWDCGLEAVFVRGREPRGLHLASRRDEAVLAQTRP